MTSSDNPKRVFSGIQPDGEVHLGNYLGAIRGWVARQDEHEPYYCIVDLHAMTQPWDPPNLREKTVATAAVLLACGIDPERSVLFIQSHVHEHTELAWVLSCVARMGELRRMVQFKEKSKGGGESVGVGLFTYPVLQTADVLLYRAHGVPVGEDQRQHVELMRDVASRFNATFGETFVIPEAWIPPTGARIMALDDPTQKMSKSALRAASKILLADPPEVVSKKIRLAVTDSGSEIRPGEDKPAVTNLLTIFSLLAGTPMEELGDRFAGRGYGDFKRELADAVVAHLEPIRRRYVELRSDPAMIEKMLGRGAERAEEIAAPVMRTVRSRVGLVEPP